MVELLKFLQNTEIINNTNNPYNHNGLNHATVNTPCYKNVDFAFFSANYELMHQHDNFEIYYERTFQSRGLIIPSLFLLITWVYIIVVFGSECPSSSCTVRISCPFTINGWQNCAVMHELLYVLEFQLRSQPA